MQQFDYQLMVEKACTQNLLKYMSLFLLSHNTLLAQFTYSLIAKRRRKFHFEHTCLLFNIISMKESFESQIK